MGNLIKDLWSYQYENKNYFGIIEVVKGEDLGQKRNEKKYETHIEKALDYTMNNKALSHMSIQTFCTWLKDKTNREDSEQRYYPFVVEFEAKKASDEYTDVVCETAVYVNYLINKLEINREDILIMINNSRSLYVFVNPKSYGAKPEKKLNRIYFEMYKKIKQDLDLKYADEGIVSSGYKLMKTPNCFYKGGYFVWITIEELMQLLTGNKTKAELTKQRRSLNKEVPGQISIKAARLYSNAAKKVKSAGRTSQEKNVISTPGCMGQCVKYLMQHMIEKGCRNKGIVSVGIYLKSIGYTKEEVKMNLIELAEGWNHDEGPRKIETIVNTIFRRNYKFSCEYARAAYEELGIENMCDRCKYRKCRATKEEISIDASIIDELWKNKAATRHYLLYLKLVNRELINKTFCYEQENINYRNLNDLCRLCSLEIVREDKENNQVYIQYKQSKKIYRLPKAFMDNTAALLGNHIKHYLRMLIKGYKALDKYILIKISKEKLMEEFEYKNISSLYKLIQKFKNLGLIKTHANSMYTLYYESYKVIEISKVKDNTSYNEKSKIEYAVASGEQLGMFSTGITLNYSIRRKNSMRNKLHEPQGPSG